MCVFLSFVFYDVSLILCSVTLFFVSLTFRGESQEYRVPQRAALEEPLRP